MEHLLVLCTSPFFSKNQCYFKNYCFFFKLKWIPSIMMTRICTSSISPPVLYCRELSLTVGRAAELSSIKREIPSLLAVVVAYKDSRVNGGSNRRRSAALMIFDWPEVTSRCASQLVLIPSVVSPSTCSSLHHARSSRVHSRRRRYFCSVSHTRARQRQLYAIAHRVDDARKTIKLAVSCACFFQSHASIELIAR